MRLSRVLAPLGRRGMFLPIVVLLVVGYAYLFLAPAAPYRSSGQMAADVKPWLAAATDTLAAAAVDPLAAIRRGAPRLPNVPHKQPVQLELHLPDKYLHRESFRSRENMFHDYGFSLKRSNELPLDRPLPDYRIQECKEKAKNFLPPELMPTVSVIIIYYNEPISTLMRNVLSVLNRSPPSLLGEIILVDDHSQMDEHESLPEHIERLQQMLPPGKLRHVRRDVHDGIVGARIRGAEEAIHDIVLFLDSHAEVCDGWLEPMIARIHEDRTRVVVPNIRGFNLDTMELTPGQPWPPSKGSFNWRLSFTIVTADIDKDILEKGDKRTSAVASPVMPGGLFAMDRQLFFELGAYDPEIKYYGAEHVELSFRVWMCGGSMESVPCSNVGHIYREFNRFGADPQLGNVNIGKVLDRNDMRVAEVWLDDYKHLFQHYRGLKEFDFGNVQQRRAVRERLQCKSFQWFLDEVCRDIYIPALNAADGQLTSPDGAYCISNDNIAEGPASVKPCAGRTLDQRWVFANGNIQRAAYLKHELICLRVNRVAQVDCASAVKWKHFTDGTIRPEVDDTKCLARGVDAGDSLKVRPCTDQGSQQWVAPGDRTISGPDRDQCLDNMQRVKGPVGMYSCHAGATQQWDWEQAGFALIKSAAHSSTCVGFEYTVVQFHCGRDAEFEWRYMGETIRPATLPELCLTREGATLVLTSCQPDDVAQRWNFQPQSGV